MTSIRLTFAIVILLALEIHQADSSCSCSTSYGFWFLWGGAYYWRTTCTSCPAGCYLGYWYHFWDSYGNYYYINNCWPCQSNCIQCTNWYACQTCASGYLIDPLNAGACKTCLQLHGTGCLTCTSYQCQTCQTPTYKLNKATGKCTIDCQSLYGTACETCDLTQCKTCTTGYVIDLSKVSQFPACVDCNTLINCQSCLNGPICSMCDANFYLDFSNSSKSCLPCSFPSCSSCVDGPTCNSCVSGYVFNTSMTNTCVPCTIIPNCTTCANGPICTICIANHFKDLSTSTDLCVPCTIPSCIQCADGPKCAVCRQNYILNTTNANRSCIPCLSDQYSFNNFCFVCNLAIAECTQCFALSAVVCTDCNPTFVPDSIGSTCIDCKLVTEHCIDCINENICTQCKHPYLAGPTGKCDQCHDGYEYHEPYCIYRPGCLTYSIPQKRCLSCFNLIHFVYLESNKSCVCEQGYEQTFQNQKTICLPVCGDGVTIYPGQACDDGNLRDNDGCDHTCSVENNFTCTRTNPSQCCLEFNLLRISHNYVSRIEGKNRCRFSFSIYPPHIGLKNLDWKKYLTLNISQNYIAPGSQVYTYMYETGQISLQFDYIKALQTLVIQATLKFDSPLVQSVGIDQVLSLNQYEVQPIAVKSSSSWKAPTVFSNPLSQTLIFTVRSNNSPLTLDSSEMLIAYQTTSMISLILSILILVQFLVGSYSHKMIGLQTVQIAQLIFFARMIIKQEYSPFMNSMNWLKYAAYCGYNDYFLVYGIDKNYAQSLNSISINQSFASVGLMRYFVLNVNIALLLPFLSLIIYCLVLAKKYHHRNAFLSSLEPSDKDKYTKSRRSSQWVYDHTVFPFINLFNMVALFCTIADLSSSLISTQQSFSGLFSYTNFSFQLLMLVTTLTIYSYEILSSYSEYFLSKMRVQDKKKLPRSTIQKLQHDENNPDRPNYKPGYVLLYLFYYFLVEVVIMLITLIDDMKDFGTYILIGLSGLYLTVIWKWEPYYQIVDFHNKAIKLNGITTVFFLLVSELFNNAKMDPIIYVVLIYLTLVLLSIVTIFGFIRIFIEISFRNKLQYQNSLLQDYQRDLKWDFSQDTDLNVSKKDLLLLKNSFVFQNQIIKLFQHQLSLKKDQKLNQDQIDFAKSEIRKEIFSKIIQIQEPMLPFSLFDQASNPLSLAQKILLSQEQRIQKIKKRLKKQIQDDSDSQNKENKDLSK